ncbi:uncharacterized protein CLUP02_17890 [Colletotrichum lupini]|uniref:Uncharacterized protein n=1 Tax=Colletotrichum lupini TaxID=145971 RepID=A0A9Q8SFE6_9PEZI|nr:uncharacterized protein CLUP02_17890 [Colletotrichum lupini]UQC76377.1 hypothetical protein CLUP02_17890 [Colletotrichum lupini]
MIQNFHCSRVVETLTGRLPAFLESRPRSQRTAQTKHSAEIEHVVLNEAVELGMEFLVGRARMTASCSESGASEWEPHHRGELSSLMQDLRLRDIVSSRLTWRFITISEGQHIIRKTRQREKGKPMTTCLVPYCIPSASQGPRSWKFDLLLLVERFRPKWSLMDTRKYFRYENLSRLPEGPGDKLPTS